MITSQAISLCAMKQLRAHSSLPSERTFTVIAEVEPFVYHELEDLLAEKSGKRSALIFLDGIEDPVNLGAILRVCACFGGFGLIIPRHRACSINETVLHIASGGENFVPVAQVNPQDAFNKIKDAGYWLVGTLVDGGENINTARLPFPLCLVVGAEGSGIRPGVVKQLDKKITLPMPGARLSLNVAMSTAVFCYEITKQQNLQNPKF